MGLLQAGAGHAARPRLPAGAPCMGAWLPPCSTPPHRTQHSQVPHRTTEPDEHRLSLHLLCCGWARSILHAGEFHQSAGRVVKSAPTLPFASWSSFSTFSTLCWWRSLLLPRQSLLLLFLLGFHLLVLSLHFLLVPPASPPEPSFALPPRLSSPRS